MAITLGGVSSALVGFAGNGDVDDSTDRLISKRTIDVITCIYSPLAILIMCYALFTYEWRSKFMRTKQVFRCWVARVGKASDARPRATVKGSVGSSGLMGLTGRSGP